MLGRIASCLIVGGFATAALLSALSAPAAEVPGTGKADRPPVSPEPADFDDDGQERARALLSRGEIQPLRDVLTRVERQMLGDVVGLAFRQRQGRWVYVFKILTTAGKRIEVEMDASPASANPAKGQ